MFIEEKLLLIDADSIYFRAAYVAYDKKKDKLNKTWKRDIKKVIDGTMRSIQGEFASTFMKVAVKGPNNFRSELYKSYKKNRPSQPEAMKTALYFGHEYMKEKYGAVESEGMEADDYVSIWAYEARAMEIPYVVVGIDKDLLQIPGDHYNFAKSVHIHMDNNAADRHLMLQCLTGDSTDNIPGIKGIGPKKAEKILHGVPPYRRWARVQAAWRKHKSGSPELSRRLLRMLTSWEEYEDIRNLLTSKTSVRKQDVLEREEEKDNGVSRVSERDT